MPSKLSVRRRVGPQFSGGGESEPQPCFGPARRVRLGSETGAVTALVGILGLGCVQSSRVGLGSNPRPDPVSPMPR